MDDQNKQPAQNMSGSMPGMKKQHGVGPAVGIVIIIVLLIAGGYYFWQQRASTMKGEGTMQGDEISVDQDDTRAALETQGSSDELVDIEQDLNATQVDSIDAELINVEQEVNI